jgi:NAD(P)H dehydrogenase (quinone)
MKHFMKIFIVYAHPEPKSLNSELFRFSVQVLSKAGHQVQVSDLYAMKWKAVANRDDFPWLGAGERLDYAEASGKAFTQKKQLPEIEAEQQKLLWADFVIFQFPIWWFSMPAILKGWVERVFAYKFGYGIGEHAGEKWGDRYGEGTLAGRKAMLVATAGGREPHYHPRGVNGYIEDLLWPIQHGIFFYPGMETLPAFIAYEVGHRTTPEMFEKIKFDYRERLLTLETTPIIQYRSQNGGDYDGQQLLKPGREDKGVTGLAIHQINPRVKGYGGES